MKKVLIFIFLIYAGFFASRVFAAGTVDINTATLSQLDTLTGIGPTYAQRIIDNRPYSSVDDLDRVKGIGPATVQKIKTQGLACVDCQALQAPTTAENNKVVNNTTPEKTPAIEPIIYPTGVFFNEILPSPKGADETDEWIELYNSNTSDVDLSGWQLQDTNGTPAIFTISTGVKILTNGFLVFKRPETKIMLNNDADGLNLLTPDKKIEDSVSFTTAPLDQSYNKTRSVWAWSTTLTPGAANIITAVVKTVSTAKLLPSAKNSVKNDVVESELADLSQTNQDRTLGSPWFLFFASLATTIILSIIVLIIKLKLNKQHVGS